VKKLGLAIFVVSAALFSLVACGPQEGEGQTPKIKVATVDVVRIMEERPETVDVRLDWKAQKGDTFMRLSGVNDEAEAAEIQEEIKKRADAWQKRMDTFMEESIELVESTATDIAKERGIQLVVVDNPMTRTVRYRDGEDITLDVNLRLQELGK